MIALDPIEPGEQFPEYDYTAALGLRTYRLVLRWRERAKSWYLSLFDAAGEPLVLGVRMVVDYALLWRYEREGMPEGHLVLLDLDGSGEECRYEDLGHRCQLVYFPRSGLPAPTTPNITIREVT